jgi:glutathione S-transferase
VFAGAKPDIERVLAIWQDCLESYGGPFLFGERTLADAMYAPVCTRFLTYDVKLNPPEAAYCQEIMAWPTMAEWAAAAQAELEELDVEF